MLYFPKYFVVVVFICVSIVCIVGLFVDVMDIDAAQYASISRQMLETYSYLEVYDAGKDYLDKPPLLFWLSVMSFKIFGVSTFAYKLPSFLFSILCVFSTYKIAVWFYDSNTGILAALILSTCQAFFLMNNDVRTDTLLTANVAFACWQLLDFTDSRRAINLVAGFTGVALAMMAKGPIGAVAPAAALLSHLAFNRELKKLLWWEWYAGIAYALLLLLPMVYGLYRQFGIEGPKFYFWTQSFGRITGQSPWHNDAGFFYFPYNFIWSFFPWSLIALLSIGTSLFDLISSGFRRSIKTPEIFSSGGFLLIFIALSFSHYKLPHYIFVVYPLSAVFTAAFIMRYLSKVRMMRSLTYLQWVLVALAFFLAGTLVIYFFPMRNVWLWLITGTLFFGMIFFYMISKSSLSKLIIPSAFCMIIINFLLNSHAYPFLLKYQAGIELARLASEEHVPKDRVYFHKYESHSFMFCFQAIVKDTPADKIINALQDGKPVWIIGDNQLLAMLADSGIKPEKIFAADDYPITKVKLEFLNPYTREKALSKKYLVEVKRTN